MYLFSNYLKQFLLLYIFFIQFDCYSQKVTKDSLRSVALLAWKYKASDGKKATSLLKHGLRLSKEFNNESYMFLFYRKLVSQKGFENKLDSALYYKKVSEEKIKFVSDSLDKYLFQGRLHSEMGEVYYRFSEIDKALQEFERAIFNFRKQKDTIGIIIGNVSIASLEFERGNSDVALAKYLYALDIFNFEEKKYSYIKAAIYEGLCSVYENLGELEKSIFYAKESLKLEYVELERYPEKITPALNRLATLEFERKNFKKAFKYLNESDSLIAYYKVESNKPIAAIIRGKFLVSLKNYKEALKVLSDVKPLLAKYNLGADESIDYYKNLGIAYLEIQDFKKALKELLYAEKIAKKSSFFPELSEIEKHLALAYNSIDKNDLAFEKLRESKKISDSIFNVDKQKIVKEIETKYQTEKKEKELLQTKAEKATTELNLNKQRQLSYTLLGGLAIILLIGFSIFQRNKRKHQLIIAQEKENNLQSIITAEEKERTRIARELHDGIVQQIGAVIINSRNIFSKLGLAEKPESKKLLSQLENSSAELRTISHQMMPRVLEEKGLITALNELLSSSLQPLQIKYDFEYVNISERLPNKIEVTLYRISQELINNIIKHSEANQVHVQLMKTETTVVFMVEDNGVGLKTSSKKGMGLQNIKSRIDIVKGSINFNSEEVGTLTTIKIPL